MNLNIGTLVGAIIGGAVGFFIAQADVQQKTHFLGTGAVLGAIVGTLLWAGLRKSKGEKKQ